MKKKKKKRKQREEEENKNGLRSTQISVQLKNSTYIYVYAQKKRMKNGKNINKLNKKLKKKRLFVFHSFFFSQVKFINVYKDICLISMVKKEVHETHFKRDKILSASKSNKLVAFPKFLFDSIRGKNEKKKKKNYHKVKFENMTSVSIRVELYTTFAIHLLSIRFFSLLFCIHLREKNLVYHQHYFFYDNTVVKRKCK